MNHYMAREKMCPKDEKKEWRGGGQRVNRNFMNERKQSSGGQRSGEQSIDPT
jgi:hypothetical protein